MMNKPPPFRGFNIRILIISPIKGRGFINHGSGLCILQTQVYSSRVWGLGFRACIGFLVSSVWDCGFREWGLRDFLVVS